MGIKLSMIKKEILHIVGFSCKRVEMNNKQKLKCLFGHHKIDEVSLRRQLQEYLTIERLGSWYYVYCINCDVGLWLNVDLPSYLDKGVLKYNIYENLKVNA